MMRLALLLAVVACSKAEPPAPPDDKPAVTPKAPEIEVELAGVTLADDCADGVSTKPTASPVLEPNAASAPRGVAAGDCGGPNCGASRSACEQTAMQLAVQVPDGAAATKIAIKRVELLDDKGAVFSTLTARDASKWNGSAYVKWDEAIATGKASFGVSYKLSSPEWTKLGGKAAGMGKMFTLRAVVTVSDKDRTIEKQATVSISIEPAAVT